MDWRPSRDGGTASHCTLESKNSAGGSQIQHGCETKTPEGIQRDLGQGTGFSFPYTMEYEPSGQSYLDPSSNRTILRERKALQNIFMRYFYKIICNHNVGEFMWVVWKHKTRKRQRQHQNPDIKGLSVVFHFILLFPAAVCNGRHCIWSSSGNLNDETSSLKNGFPETLSASYVSESCSFRTHTGSTPSCPMQFVNLAG